VRGSLALLEHVDIGGASGAALASLIIEDAGFDHLALPRTRFKMRVID